MTLDFSGGGFGRRYVVGAVERFLKDTPSVRRAASVIVAATTAITVAAALAMRIFDSTDFPNIGRALWWAAQTVTTVGYGDVTPRTLVGRLIGAVVMLQGVAFIAVITASITSTFVARAQRQLGVESDRWEALDERLAALDARMHEVAQALGGSPSSSDVRDTAERFDSATNPAQEGLT